MQREFAWREQLYQRYVSTFKGQRRHGAASYAWWDHKYLPLLRDLPRDAAILELGCGTGEFLGYLAERGFRNARGVDISAEQVALARQRGVTAECGDLFGALERDTCDAILAIDVLEHLTRDELLRLGNRAFEALRPGGRLLVQTANGAGLFPGQVMYGDLTHLTIFSEESLSQLLQQAGFVDLRLFETGPVPMRLRGRVNVLLWALVKLLANSIRRIETGTSQQIWTQNLICLAQKPKPSPSSR